MNTHISVKTRKKWAHHKNFHYGVSMGSRLSRGDSLAAIVDWINAQGFEQGYIDVSDTLNRFNHMIAGIPEDEAFELARDEGQHWIAQNSLILKRLKSPYRIITWDHWLQKPKYQEYESIFHDVYEHDLVFRAAVQRDLQHHCTRFFGENLNECSLQKIELSTRFYLEEMAGFLLQFENYPCAEIYPGHELECAKMIKAGLVKNVPQGMANATFVQLFVVTDPMTMREKKAVQVLESQSIQQNLSHGSKGNEHQ